METPNNLNSKSVKKAISSSFVLVGMSVVLSYGFAALVLIYGGRILGNSFWFIILLGAIVVVQIVIFFVAVCFVKTHNKKLYGTSATNIELDFVKMLEMKLTVKDCISLAKAVKVDANLVKLHIGQLGNVYKQLQQMSSTIGGGTSACESGSKDKNG